MKSLRYMLLPSILPITGCSTIATNESWGSQTTLTPGWSVVKQATKDAAMSPKTWLPLTAGLLTYATGQDAKISTWARDTQPIFGKDAAAASSELRDSATNIYYISVVLTPGSSKPAEWLIDKAKGITVGAATYALTSEITDLAKERVGRERPNKENTRSFLSGHTTSTATNFSLTDANMRSMEINEDAKENISYGLYGATILSAWSRVEAGAHYPSDVLASMALSNFATIFMYNSFLTPRYQDSIVYFDYHDGSTMINIITRF